MRRIILSIAMIIVCSLLSAGNRADIPGKALEASKCIQKCDMTKLQTSKTSYDEPMVNCSIKVKGNMGGGSFVGSVTFHDISIFHCAVIKLMNLF